MHSLNMTQVLRHAESEPNIAGYTKNYRTRNEGIRNRAKGVEGSQMRDIMTPPARIPPKTKKKEVKDFTQENILRIRKMSAKRQEEAQNGTKPLRGTWNGSKYSQVPSKVFAQLEERIKNDIEKSHLRSRPSSHQPLSTIQRAKSDMNLTPALRKLALSTTTPSPNYVRRNSQTVQYTPLRSKAVLDKPKEPMNELQSIPKGKVGGLPAELQENKEIRERARKITSDAEKYSLPPGSYLMDEKERSKLLIELSEAKINKEREIFLLPVSTDTLRARKKREELEKALQEIDEGLNILSKPKVIVQDSEYVKRIITAARTLNEHMRKTTTSSSTETMENGKKSSLKKNTVVNAAKSAMKPQTVPLRTGQTKFYKPSSQK